MITFDSVKHFILNSEFHSKKWSRLKNDDLVYLNVWIDLMASTDLTQNEIWPHIPSSIRDTKNKALVAEFISCYQSSLHFRAKS